jgi:protein gp37
MPAADRRCFEEWVLGESYPANVWLGVSAEDQENWDKRVPSLVTIPAAKRFISVEPMLSNIDMSLLQEKLRQTHSKREGPIHLVIFGGESGPKARPCNVEWIRDGLRQCREAGVPAFVKQVGSKPVESGVGIFSTPDPKGGDPYEWPMDIRVREWPT